MCMALLQGRKGKTLGEVCCFLPGFSVSSDIRRAALPRGSMYGRRLRVGRPWIHGRRLRVRRRGEGEPPAAHTLTPTLLPTTCVVVNKLVGLTLSDNRGCAPPVRKCLPPTVKSPQEAPPPRTASQVRGIAASTEGAGWADRRYRVLVAARHPLPAPLHRCGHGGFDSGQA